MGTLVSLAHHGQEGLCLVSGDAPTNMRGTDRPLLILGLIEDRELEPRRVPLYGRIQVHVVSASP